MAYTPADYAAVGAALRAQADDGYRAFTARLLPPGTPLLGVRLPALHALSRTIAAGDWQGFLACAGHATHEERLLQGLVIARAPCTGVQRRALLAAFTPLINNWAVCDTVCAACRFGEEELAALPAWLRALAAGGDPAPRRPLAPPYTLRFCVVLAMTHLLTPARVPAFLQELETLPTTAATVSMAVAWAASVCGVLDPAATLAWLENAPLDDATRRRTVQKLVDSHRVSPADKARARTLRSRTPKR